MSISPTTSAAPVTGAAPGQQAPAENTPPPSPQDPDARLQAALDIIAKRERENGRREQEWKVKDREYATYAEKAKAFDTFLERFKADPLSILEEHGIELDSLNERALKAPIDPAVREVKSELQRIKEELRAERAEKTRQSSEQSDKEFRARIDSFVEGKEQYELINAQGASELIYQVVAQHWHKTLEETGTGEVMDLEVAADLVEKHLEGEVERLSKTKKLSARFQPPPSEPTKPNMTPANSDPATLTNGMRAVTEPASGNSRVSDAELTRRALAKLTQTQSR